jgi:hypothetical protein
VYLVRVYLVVLALGQVFRLKSPFLRAMATSCVLFFIAHLPGGVVFNVTADVYYWFFAGLLLLVMRLHGEQAGPGSVDGPSPALGRWRTRAALDPARRLEAWR